MPLLHWAQFPVSVCLSVQEQRQEAEAQTVQFEAARYLSVETKAVGETTVYSSNGVLKRASIRLAEGAAIPEDLQATAAHEFGHALGISGHSEDAEDLMYSVEINHFNAMNQPLPGAVHTAREHDLRMLKECYPGLFGNDRRP